MAACSRVVPRRRQGAASVLILLLGALSRAQSATFVTPPSNVAGTYGEDLTLKCEVSGNTGSADPFEWVKLLGTQRLRLYADFPNVFHLDADKYHVSGHDLTVKDLSWQDGARYACSVYTQGDSTAWLLAFKKPVLELDMTSASEGQTVTAQCTSAFGADRDLSPDITPRMEIKHGTRGLDTDFSISDYVSGQPYTVSGRSEFKANAADDDQNVTCELSLDEPAWSTRTGAPLRVTYGARDIVFSPLDSDYVVGSRIHCSAEGNPAPSYTWQAINSPIGNGTFLEGASLEITRAMVGNNKWTCTAANTVNSQTDSAMRELSFRAKLAYFSGIGIFFAQFDGTSRRVGVTRPAPIRCYACCWLNYFTGRHFVGITFFPDTKLSTHQQ